MKKFKVIAAYTTYCEAEIEAEDEQQAYWLATQLDGSDFTCDPVGDDLDGWHISSVNEVTP